MPGGILALSSNGISGALLWSNEAFGNLPGDPAANINPTPNILRAYDASTAGTGSLQAIWDSEAAPDDRVGAATKFAPPLVANGKVYMATYDNQIVVYGSVRPRRRRHATFAARSCSSTRRPRRTGSVRARRSEERRTDRIRHRNWLNDHTNHYRWGAYLDWQGAEIGQARHRPTLVAARPPIGARASLRWDSPSCRRQDTASPTRTRSECITGCWM
jgi:hypothetical protein